jgi:beta-galactosidase
METQPGHVSWAPANNTLNKGEARTMAWHAVAHGADAVLYWQWRSAPGGQEQYHGTLVDQSGQPRPFFEEAQQLGREFAKVSSLLAGSTPEAKVAILNCYDSRWSLQWQRHHSDFDYVAHLLHYYRPFAARNIPVDIVSADAPLEKYRLVIAPALAIMDESRAERLMAYPKYGKNLVFTARCAMKDAYNAFLPSRQPGSLVELTGAEVEEYYALDEPVPVKGNWFEGVSQLWAERLKLIDETTAAVIARYGPSNGWLDDQVAIIVRGTGSSLIYYVGTNLDDDAQQKLFDRIARTVRAKPVLELPAGVGASVRVTPEGERVYIVINHERQEKMVELPWAAQEHLSGQPLEGEFKLVPYGVAVLTKSA